MRVDKTYFVTGAASGTTGTETAITLTRASDLSGNTTGTSFAIDAGKDFFITSVIFASRGHNTATAQATTFSIRVNPSGSVATNTTPIILKARTATPSTANSWDRYISTLVEPIKIIGGTNVQIGVTANAVFTTNAPTWDVLITGYEY